MLEGVPPDVTVSAQILRLLLAGAATRGLDPASVIEEHRIDPLWLADLDARAPAETVLAVWTSLQRRTELPHFGVWLAELALAVPRATLAGHLIQSAPTLGDGLSRLLAFERVMNGVQSSELVLQGESAFIRHRAPEGIGPGKAPAIEFAFAWMVGIGRRTTGTSLVPLAVSFAHAPPASVTEHTRFFGVAPTFGPVSRAVEDLLVLPREALALPQTTADEIVKALTERHARALLERLPVSSDLVSRVRAHFAERISLGETPDVGLDALATALRLPPRTLQRRLAADDTSYQALLDDARRTLAVTHLADPGTSIAEVAFALGFQDQSAFHRAFVRWTGTTPGEYRRRALAPDYRDAALAPDDSRSVVRAQVTES